MRLLSKTSFYNALFLKILLISTVLLTQGCVSTTNQQSIIGELIIAEPIAIKVKDEIAVERISQVLLRAKISDEQRAELFYQRGLKYDTFGLRTLAHIDFNQAINLKPDMVDAYNFLGIHFTQMQEFNQSYDAFDSAIELDPSYQFAYFNRGIALYYGGRPNLAVDDFNAFRSYQQDDPFRLLWQYLAESAVEPQKAKQELIVNAEIIDDSIWAKNIIKLYLGEISQDTFIGRLADNINTNEALTERLCEAYFYLGKYNQMQDDVYAAMNFFKLALSTNVYKFVEHRYAKLELDLMRQALQQSSEP